VVKNVFMIDFNRGELPALNPGDSISRTMSANPISGQEMGKE